MSAATMTRVSASSGLSSVSRRSHLHARPVRPTVSFVRPSRVRSTATQAFFNNRGWSGGWATPTDRSAQSAYRAWRAAQASYDYSRGRCYPCSSGSKPHSGASSNPNRKPSLPYDVIQMDSSYQLFVDIPGLAKPDLKIRVSNPKSDKVQGSSLRVLTISGERQAPLQEGYVQKQRLFGGFENMWELPADAESEGISAKVTDGVLIVTVPKKQQQPEVDDSQEVFIS